MHQYEQYSSEQLAMDLKFQEWVLHPTDENNEDWQGFLTRFPHRRMIVEEAVDLVRHAGLSTDVSANHAYLEGWTKVERQIQASTPNSRWTRYAAAAAFAGIAAAAVYFIVYRPGSEQYTTAFGETSEIALADGTRVLLNAHSSLTVDELPQQTGPRVVTLEGDAFFDVRHFATDRPFIVHTAREVDVHVTGTTFEVRQRQSGVEVMLTEGKVKMISGDQEASLEPGQLAVAFSRKIEISNPKAEAAAARIAWVGGQYVMNEETLSNVALHITEHFGKQVIIERPELSSVTVSGKVPANDLSVLLEVIKQTLSLKVEEKEGSLYITSDLE